MNNDQKQADKPTETTKHTLPQGAQPAAGQTYETPEPKRRDAAAPEEAKRAPQHEPGYEAKQQKEAQKEAHKRPASERSQADDSMAKIDADRDVDASKTQKANRTQTARRKHEVKRAKVRKHK